MKSITITFNQVDGMTGMETNGCKLNDYLVALVLMAKLTRSKAKRETQNGTMISMTENDRLISQLNKLDDGYSICYDQAKRSGDYSGMSYFNGAKAAIADIRHWIIEEDRKRGENHEH